MNYITDSRKKPKDEGYSRRNFMGDVAEGEGGKEGKGREGKGGR